MGASGLRRIRQQPGSRGVSAHRAASLNINPTPAASRHPSTSAPTAPSSPTLAFGEDLTRFSSESLHSFSFATQSDDFVHNRQNVLKRSIDFMQNKLGWAATNPGIAQAQAKISGDKEVQSMIELLTRANLIGNDATGAHGMSSLGPLTGPAELDGENIFEKSFVDIERSNSPESMLGSAVSPTHKDFVAARNGDATNENLDTTDSAIFDDISEVGSQQTSTSPSQ